MKTRIISIFIALILSCGFATSSLAQVSYFNTDTLSFEYEGPIQEHYNIAVRQLSRIGFCTNGNLNIWYKGKTLRDSPLIKSLIIRLNEIVEEKQKTINYNKICSFNNGSEALTSQYFDVMYHFLCNSPNSRLTKVMNEMKDEQFLKLVSDAYTKGIKQVSTSNGFYDKKLAKKITRALLFNNINKLIRSNIDLGYRIIKIGDYFTALGVMEEDLDDPYSFKEKKEDELLQIILNRKNLIE